MSLLIVDDSRAARMLIRSIITEYNSTISIIEAENGEQAVEIFEAEKPELVFLDLTMPVMDGFEALKKIIKINSKAVVIVLTADIQEKSVRRCMDSGAYMVMKKLPRKEEIFKTLDEIMDSQD
jgi:two-component system chemotaxis response regulator CheY